MKKIAMFILIFATMIYAKTDVNKLIKDVQKKYKSIDALEIDFKQVSRFKLTGNESEIYGTLIMSHDDKFRLETEDQTMVSNGETFWRYNKLEKQVLIDYAKKSQQDVFLNNFLFNISDHYYSQILSNEKIDGKNYYQVKLTPKDDDESYFDNIKVWIGEKTLDIKRIVYQDYNGNENEYDIEKFEIDPKLSGKEFTFTSPEGVEVIDLRF